MEYNQESFRNSYNDAKDLLEHHHLEVPIFEGKSLLVNQEKYQRMEDNGSLKIFTIRVDGKLVGYSSFFIFVHSHHADSIHANMDTIYIKPEFRGIGLDFASYCDEQLKYIGVSFVHRGFPVDRDWGEKLIDQGYKQKEIIYIKELL